MAEISVKNVSKCFYQTRFSFNSKLHSVAKFVKNINRK